LLQAGINGRAANCLLIIVFLFSLFYHMLIINFVARWAWRYAAGLRDETFCLPALSLSKSG